METKRQFRLLPIVVALLAGLMFGPTAPGDARTGDHEKMLDVGGHFKARIIKKRPLECLPDARRCHWVGRVRIVNLRALGTPPVKVCVGIDVFAVSADLTPRTSLSGQVTVRVAPGEPKRRRFDVSYRVRPHTPAVDVGVMHVHRYGNPC
jgi:hypothetical protein